MWATWRVGMCLTLPHPSVDSEPSDLTKYSGKFSEDIGEGQEDVSFQRLAFHASPNQNNVISDRITR